jgi:LDH2 family malate/lactate/ureidoglycolate dehydrogenase
MNKQPIATARDADLRLSVAAMHRAAQRARELARQTGTAIVISRGGVVQHIELPAAVPPASDRGKP